MEMLIASALFSIILIAVFPYINHAGRNLAYAQSGYEAHLMAQSLMLSIRSAVIAGDDPADAARILNGGRFVYSFWVFGAGETEYHSSGLSAAADISGFTGPGSSSQIIVIVWNEYDYIAGRAFGLIP
jgi:Tfp pilus assembly protein PilV